MTRLYLFGAALLACLFAPTAAQADFGIVPGSVSTTAVNQDGSIARQAGSHPYEYAVHFDLKTDESGHPEGGRARDIIVDLPPGLFGNPLAAPRCTRQLFEGIAPRCSLESQIGVLRVNLPETGEVAGPIYNMIAPPGVAGQLGFSITNKNALQGVSVRTEHGYGLEVSAFNVPVEVTSVTASIWGVPSDPSHDGERGLSALDGHGPAKSTAPPLPFLTLPASCEAPPEITVKVDSQLNPGNFVEKSAPARDAGGAPAPMAGCESVPFAPRISSAPSSQSAESPSGLGFQLRLPNQGLLGLGAVSETEPQKIEVALPEGLTANPAAASGLGACSQQQFEEANGQPGVGCPEASKLGTVIAHSPLIEEPVEGAVYLAAPDQNPFGSLLALYIVAAAPERGVLVKQAGEVQADAVSGRLTTTVDGLPPLPYSSFELRLREGPRAPLVSPRLCGTYNTVAKLYPFSEPSSPVVRTVPFTISSGAGGGPCAYSEAALPNHPALEAGTVTPLAGTYSPFVLKLSREDGSQWLRGLNLALPPGISAKFAGRAECSDTQIAQAEARKNRGEGALERQSPSCPPGSELGTVTVGAGSGSPFYATGRAYLAGPYRGAPFSIVAITPAIAGPFDLGVVVVRSALYVNEETAQGTVKTDPIPTILQGIPLQVRSIAIKVDNGDFSLNPTSCEAKTITAEAISPTGNVARLSNPFQVGGCKGLEFKPQLKIQLKGATKRVGHPALKAVATYPKGGGYANIARAQVNLPHSEFLDQGNLNKTCTKPVLVAGNCPASSVYGHAEVWTPLLEQPLRGPVYLVGGYGYKLPALVAELNGQVRILLVGKVDSGPNKGIRNTFEAVPDAPVEKFVLQMKGGKKYGLLENSENLCKASKKKRRAIVRFTGQNGKVDHYKPVVANQCGKGKKKGHGGNGGGRKGGKKGH